MINVSSLQSSAQLSSSSRERERERGSPTVIILLITNIPVVARLGYTGNSHCHSGSVQYEVGGAELEHVFLQFLSVWWPVGLSDINVRYSISASQ